MSRSSSTARVPSTLARWGVPAALGAALLASCGGPPELAGTPPAPAGGPEVSLDFPAGTPRYGELVRARLAVGNGGGDPLVIRGVELPGQLPVAARWLVSLPGRVEADAHRRRFVWRPWAPDATGPLFARGVVFPGEALALDCWIRVRGPVQDVVLHYQEVPASTALDSIYLAGAGIERSQRPAEVVFSAPDVTRLTRFRSEPPGSEGRIALFPDARHYAVARRHFALDLAWEEEHMPQAVLEQLGSGELSVWSGGPAWLLRDPDGGTVTIFLEDGGVESFEGVELAVFDLADLRAQEGLPLRVEEPGVEELREVAPQDLLEILRESREKGSRVEVTRWEAEGWDWELGLRLW